MFDLLTQTKSVSTRRYLSSLYLSSQSSRLSTSLRPLPLSLMLALPMLSQGAWAAEDDVHAVHEVFVTAYGESAKTFPAVFPMLSLDRIYVRNARVHSPVVLPRRPWSHLSDHAPLVAEIAL